MTKTSLLLTSTLFLGLVFPAFAQDEHGHRQGEHEASLGELSIVHAWTRAAGEGEKAVVFFEIENGGAPIELTGAEAEIAANAQIVGASMGADGAVAFQPLGAFTIPSGDFAFDPNGLGVELTGLTEALEQGEHFHMHLLLGGEELKINVDVEAADASAHSHAGHTH